MNRTGIPPGSAAVGLYSELCNLPGLEVVGVHAFDGHVLETDLQQRTALCEQLYEPVKQMVKEVNELYHSSLKVVLGGSPSFPVYAAHTNVECSPGTFVFWDAGYAEMLPIFNP